jgi:hypothetical protein
MKMENFERKISRLKTFYFEWRGKEKPSKCFQGEVIRISRSGWNHLISSPRRSKKEILERISLLPFAKRLLEESTFVQTYREENDREYWSLQGLFENVPVRVIIRSVRKGSKHFYSVFSPIKENRNQTNKKPLSRLAPMNGVGGAEH